MRLPRLSQLVMGLALLAFLATPKPAFAGPVGLELLLLVDVSGSVSTTEYNLQKLGYVNAFLDPGIQAQIASITGGVAVAYVEWSGASQQSTEVGWTLLTGAASATAFSAAIAASVRDFSGSTAIGSAINYGLASLAANSFAGARTVIDVSGDGATNDGTSTSAARNAAAALGFTINGLVILGESGLAAFYTSNVITTGGTLYTAADFDSFETAVRAKIGEEIAPVIPEPATMTLLGIGLSGLAGRAWRKRKASRS